MLNDDERSALDVESAASTDVPTVEYAAGQQVQDTSVRTAFENLGRVVTHNLQNPDDRMKLSAEDARALLNDFIAGSPESNQPMTEDGRIKTFAEMSDDEIMTRLPDYLASGTTSSGINNGMIEEAQAVMAEAFMSEEELQDNPDPKSPKGRAARERKLVDAAREANEEMNERMAAHQKKWDQDFHDYGGERLSGEEIMERMNWFSKKENQEKVRQELIKKGKSEQEAQQIIDKMKERDELLKRQRDGIPPLTPEEKARLNALNKDRDVIAATAELKRQMSSEEKVDIDRQAQLKSPKNETIGQAISIADQQLAELERKSSDLETQSSAKVVKPSADTLTSSESAYQHFSGAPIVKEAFEAAANDPIKPLITPEPQKISPTATVAKLNNDIAAMM